MGRKISIGFGLQLLCLSAAQAVLIAQWDFEATLTNSVSSSYGGVFTAGTPVYSPDAKSGSSSLLFSNPGWTLAATNKLDISGGGNWGGSSNWSFSAWIKPTTVTGTVFSARGVSGGYTLYCDIRNNTLKTYYNDDGTNAQRSAGGNFFAHPNNWSLLTVVFDADNRKVQVYRYCEETSPTDMKSLGLVLYAEAVYDVPMTLSNFVLGYGTGSLQQGFNGNMDRVRIYNHALTQSEIESLIPKPPSLGIYTITGKSP